MESISEKDKPEFWKLFGLKIRIDYPFQQGNGFCTGRKRSAITKSDSVLLLVRFRTSAVITQLVEYPTRNLECFGSNPSDGFSDTLFAGADEGERHFGIR